MEQTVQYPNVRLFIGGHWRDASDGATGQVVNPASGAVIGTFPIATISDLDEALESSWRGFEIWRALDPAERCAVLQRAAALIRERASAIANTLTLEQGKPFNEARGEVMKAADMVDWGAQEGRRTYGRTIPSKPGLRLMTVQEPIGPVAAFAPWNFPAISPIRKLAGALSAGCSCILKASEEVPATAMEMVHAFVDAGIPAGVVNFVLGEPAAISSHLLASPIVRKLTFTGSVPVGKHLAGLAAQNMKSATMELGGHSPVIVFDDVDAEPLAEKTARAKFRNAGQICTAPTRFLVQEAIYEKFAARFAATAGEIRVGGGFDVKTEMGPVVNERRLQAIESLVQDAVASGAKLLSGGRRIGNVGSFYAPTVLGDVPLNARIMNEEPFGPVAIINRFEEPRDAIAEANRLPYGLAAYAFTTSTARAHSVSRSMESGLVGLNTFNVSYPETPFGGVKDSGYGREGGAEGIEGYMTKRLVAEEFA